MSDRPCHECGSSVAAADRFCSSCGSAVGGSPRPPAPVVARSAWLTRSRLAALAVSSAVATGTILGAGLGGPSPVALAAALLGGPAAATGSGSASPLQTASAAAGSAGLGASHPLSPGAATAGAAAGEASQPSAGGVSGVVGGAAAGSQPTPASTTPTSTPATTPARKQSAVKHVFLIVLASHGYDATFGDASRYPYLDGDLRKKGALLSEYHAIAHGDLPNYLALISGQPPNAQTEAGCTTYKEFPAGTKPGSDGIVPGDGCVYPLETLTLADQLGSAGLSWGAYAEDTGNGTPAARSCRRPGPNATDPTQQGRPGDEYAARHNPFVYFHSLLDLGDCATKDVGLDQLPAALKTAKATPNLVFIAPNLCHDGSEDPCADGSAGGPAAADAFLAKWVPQILASPAYKRDGLLAITFADAPAGDDSGGGGRVGALLLSRFAKAGATSTVGYDHLSMLHSIEDFFGLGYLGRAGGDGVQSFGTEVLSGVF